MNIMNFIISVLAILPFVLLCLACKAVNLEPTRRGRQFLMPLLAVVYCIVASVTLADINRIISWVIRHIAEYFPAVLNVQQSGYMIFVENSVLVAGFLLIKAIALPILNRIWGNSRNLMEATSAIAYEYADDVDKWLLKKEYGQLSYFYAGMYYAAVGVAAALFLGFRHLDPLRAYSSPEYRTEFFPVFAILIIGEVIWFLSGITKSEFVEDILGEDEESYKIANYGLLRDVLRELFKDRVLFDTTVNSGLDNSTTFETLDQMCGHENPNIRNLGEYFKALQERGEEIDSNYVKSCVNLMLGKSTLFCNPFYRDLTRYIMIPMLGQLMRYRKCLVVLGRDSAADDVKAWLDQSILESTNTDSLWKAELLGCEPTETDIGIIKFSDLYNFEIQKQNQEFLKEVGFVLIIEPSRLLATGQMGLRLLVNQFDEERRKVVYCACDRNCDGLVDALSHTVRTTITEVMATASGAATTSLMCWEADGPYMHHKILSNISRYLGVGTEINAVAMKYQIANTKWISSEKFPVLDMKWIAGQYYKKICDYTNLPITQEAFSKAFHVDSNLWSSGISDNAFVVVEDEYQNLFEAARLFATRAREQGFINVISENYLLRDYMLENVQTFMTDPKAIPTIVPDYARTERNTVLKLIMRMTGEQVSEEEIADIFMINGISFEEPLDTLKMLIRKHCFLEEVNIRIYFREQLMADAFRTEVKKYYAIEDNTEIAEYAKNLKNAYYIAEDEKGETHYIGAKLYGHVFQAMIPGQFLTFAGKYYEVQSVTPQNGVVVRRAADHITNRKYYRQIRHISLTDWKDDESVGGRKTIADIQVAKGYCQIAVHTDGYLEMASYEDLKTARKIHVSGIPVRTYRNKLVLKINMPGTSEKIRHTICLMLNEIFKTTYPDSHPYICAVTQNSLEGELFDNLKYAMYTMETDGDNEGIYIVEDSEIDLGLIVSVERNLKRYLEIVTELLIWHGQKMQEKPVKEEPEAEYVPEFPEEPVKGSEKKKGFFGRIIEKIKKFFGKLFKKKPKSEAEEPTTEATEPTEPTAEEPTVEDAKPETAEPTAPEVTEPTAEEAAVPTEDVKPETAEPTVEPTAEEAKPENTASRSVLRNDGLDIEGEDEEVVSTEEVVEEMTTYQKNCFLKFGYDDFGRNLDFEGTISYLVQCGYDKNPLYQVRDGMAVAEEYEKTYDPHKTGAHFCDFCGIELAGGEYELLKDGRERCNHCSATALRTGEEFKKVFKTVMRNMEIFYGIKLNVAIKVRMTDAKKIAKHFGEEFVATPGFDGRTLGFAQKDSTGYSIYVENGSPKLAAMATIAHELTHIWQYENWNDSEIVAKYGAQNRLIVYEGMAKWAEIQYLYYLNEITYGKREEIVTRLRDDVYGKGFILYAEKYPLSYRQEKNRTPFNEIPPL